MNPAPPVTSTRIGEGYHAETRVRVDSGRGRHLCSPRAMPANERRFVVLDRDGTLIVEKHYLSDPDAVELIEGAGDALRRLAALDLGLVVVTNQSGIGRGLFDRAGPAQVHARLEQLLAGEGVRLGGIYARWRPAELSGASAKPRTDPL